MLVSWDAVQRLVGSWWPSSTNVPGTMSSLLMPSSDWNSISVSIIRNGEMPRLAVLHDASVGVIMIIYLRGGVIYLMGGGVRMGEVV